MKDRKIEVNEWEEEYKNPYFSIEKSRKFYMDDDRNIKREYYRIKNSPSVIIYALTPKDRVLLVEQMRPNINKTTIELPAGGIEKEDNTNMEAAKREIREETGWECDLMEVGNNFWTTINRNTMPDHGYIGIGKKEICTQTAYSLTDTAASLILTKA